jgi:hypothetical protein
MDEGKRKERGMKMDPVYVCRLGSYNDDDVPPVVCIV